MSNYDDNVIRYSEGSSSLYGADQAVQQIIGGGAVGNEAILTSGAFSSGAGGASSYSVTTTSYGSGSGASSAFGAGGASYASSAQYGGGYSSGAIGGGASSALALSSAGSVSAGQYLSEIEASILRSTVPITVNETEEISVIGQRGIWANRSEVISKKDYNFNLILNNYIYLN